MHLTMEVWEPHHQTLGPDTPSNAGATTVAKTSLQNSEATDLSLFCNRVLKSLCA